LFSLRETGAVADLASLLFSFGEKGVFEDEVYDFGLADVEAGLGLEEFAHFDAIELFIALGAGAPDGGTAGGVQEPKLNAYSVGDLAHDAAECVDFADKMALGDSADGGVAAHLGDEVEVHGDEGGLESHARGGHGGLASGVACADHGDVVLFGESHPYDFRVWAMFLRLGFGFWGKNNRENLRFLSLFCTFHGCKSFVCANNGAKSFVFEVTCLQAQPEMA
jgi:hypothetical protein